MLFSEHFNFEDLKFDGGYLKSLTVEDIHEGYIDGLNDHDVNRYLVNVRAVPLTIESAECFVKSNRSSTSAILFGIWVDGINDFIGTVRVHSIEMENRTAEIGICIFDKNCWGKGLGRTVIRTVTQWLHDEIGIRWVEAGAYSGNIASVKLFASSGYTREYVISGKYLYDGKPVDVEIFASKKNL